MTKSLPIRPALVGALLAGLAVLVAPAPAAFAASSAYSLAPVPSARVQASPWAGTWLTSNGVTLNWVQAGDHVSGNWTVGAGSTHLEGIVAGNVLHGTWTNPTPSDPPLPGWDDGTVELTLSADGNSWSGWTTPVASTAHVDISATRVGDGGTDTPPAEDCSGPRALPPPGVPRPAARDCTPPKVRAFPFKKFVEPGERIKLEFSVKDNSGRVKARATLFEGGQYIRNARYSGKTGGRLVWTVDLPATLEGPMFACIWAKDAAGNKSAGAPRSSCAWIKMVVPIGRVSNGCGGEGWDAVVSAENYFGNTSTYYGEDGTPYEVSFVDACNLHDAGYGGHTVYDRFTGAKIDFHGWSRAEVDEKFRMDMEKLCEEQIPAEEQQARAECKANLRYPTVRTVGGLFFDADPMHVGTQSEGTRSND